MNDRVPQQPVSGRAPRVSVVMPLYNLEATVAAALGSLQGQTFEDWEAIVVDDGSTDAGPSEVASAARRDARVRPFRQPNAGVSAARSRGLSLARGEHVLFLDADDELVPEGLERLVSAARGTAPGDGPPATRGAFGGFALVSERGEVLDRVRPQRARLGLDCLLGSVFVPLHSVLTPTAWAQRVGFRALIPGPGGAGCVPNRVEDTDHLLGLGLCGVEWVNAGAEVCRYVLRAGSRSGALGEMLGATRACYSDAYARARSAGLAGRVDASPDRLGLVLTKAAWGYATRRAILGDAGALEAAAGLMAGVRPEPRVDEQLLVHIARRAVNLALRRPARSEALGHAPDWAGALAAWWDRCVGLGLIGRDTARLAQRLLADLCAAAPGVSVTARAGLRGERAA